MRLETEVRKKDLTPTKEEPRLAVVQNSGAGVTMSGVAARQGSEQSGGMGSMDAQVPETQDPRFPKKTWSKPVLVVLGRGALEENVLAKTGICGS
jgi:hypothetical protein